MKTHSAKMGESCIVVLKCINGLNGPLIVTILTLCPQVQDLYLSPGLGFISSLSYLVGTLAFGVSVVMYEFRL